MCSQDTEKTGWQRLTSLLNSIWNNERPEELKELYKACIVSGVTGFMFGGYAQARRSRVHFIDTHNTSIFPSHMQAQRQLHSAVAIGFVRGGFLWGWKLGAFAGIFSICHIGITVYRNKEGVLNIVTGGVVSGACYRLFIDGLSGMAKGAVLGTLVRCNHRNIPASLVIVGIDKLFIGPEVRKEITRTRLEVQRKKDELWLQRLGGTTDIMTDINSNERSEGGLDRHYELIPPSEDNIIKRFIDKATGFLFRTTEQKSNNKDSN